MNDRQRLIALLAERSARRGQFTLASGRQSTLYIDARLTTMSPDGLALIGRKLLYINLVEQLYPDDDRQRLAALGCRGWPAGRR